MMSGSSDYFMHPVADLQQLQASLSIQLQAVEQKGQGWPWAAQSIKQEAGGRGRGAYGLSLNKPILKSNQQHYQHFWHPRGVPSSWSQTHLLITSSNFTFYFQVNDMFMWLVQPCLEFIRLQCKSVVQTSPIHLAFSMMRLYSSLLGKHCV